MKPIFGDFNRELIAPEFQWFWDRRSLVILFHGKKPLCLVNGQYQDIITKTEGTTGGTSSEKIDIGPTGVRADFSGADGAGGGEWAYHIADSDLPDWFPAKDGGSPSNAFTMLTLISPQALSGTSETVIQKNATTGTPILLFIRSNGRSAIGGSGTSQTTTLLSAGREEMLGCVYDGADQYVIGQARWQDPVTTTITSNTGPLNIGTRSATIDPAASRFNGSMSGLIFIDMAINGKFLAQLDNDFFGPFRSQPFDNLFDQQEYDKLRAEDSTIRTINNYSAGRIR